jgi:site-specific DNA-methyltransferase (adenine-specific)
MVKKRVKKLPKKGALTLDTIYHGNSLDGMKFIADCSIDLVITSPPYADMKVYAGGFAGFHPDNYVKWFLPYVSEIARILKPTGSFILNINDKSQDGFRHPFIFELIFAIHNIEGYCKMKNLDVLDMHGLKLFERLFWNKGKYLAHPKRFGDKVEYLFWFSKTKERKFNMDPMRLEYDAKSVKRMQRPLLKRFVRESGEEVVEYKQGGEGSWAPNELGALPSVLVEEGAMLHVKPVVENLPEGTVLIGDNLDDYNLVIQPKIGDKPHPSTVVNIGSEARRIAGNHVAVYPERLVNYFIQGSTDPGDVVLDPFMGTGTTAVVAKALGRHYYGFDISDDYVRTAMERIESGPYLDELKKAEKANAQKTLFD